MSSHRVLISIFSRVCSYYTRNITLLSSKINNKLNYFNLELLREYLAIKVQLILRAIITKMYPRQPFRMITFLRAQVTQVMLTVSKVRFLTILYIFILFWFFSFSETKAQFLIKEKLIIAFIIAFIIIIIIIIEGNSNREEAPLSLDSSWIYISPFYCSFILIIRYLITIVIIIALQTKVAAIIIAVAFKPKIVINSDFTLKIFINHSII